MKIFSLFLILFIGCASWTKPDREDYKIESCYRADRCYWENANTPDHKNNVNCTDAEKECRAFEKYMFAKDPENRWKNHDEDQCWDKLNNK